MRHFVYIGCGLLLLMGALAALTMPDTHLRHISSKEAAAQCTSHAVIKTELHEGGYHYYECYGSSQEIPAYQ